MKCRYIFPVKSRIQFPVGIKFSVGDRLYEFIVKEGVVSKLTVIISNFPEDSLPSIIQSKEGKSKASITIPIDPFWDDLVSDIRTIEGACCLWGIDEINLEHFTTEWIPETESDKAKIDLLSFSFLGPKNMSPIKPPESPVALFVRSILSASDLKEWETPLNFYRRGFLDTTEDKYIDAVYDLFFVLETLFAGGKFKKSQVIQRLNSSQVLLDRIDAIKKEIPLAIRTDKKLLEEFRKKYFLKSNKEIIEYLVNLRGFLHHHTISRKNMWHPAKQREYKVDALILLHICFEILSARVLEILFKEGKYEEFLRIEVKTADGKKIRWI